MLRCHGGSFHVRKGSVFRKEITPGYGMASFLAVGVSVYRTVGRLVLNLGGGQNAFAASVQPSILPRGPRRPRRHHRKHRRGYKREVGLLACPLRGWLIPSHLIPDLRARPLGRSATGQSESSWSVEWTRGYRLVEGTIGRRTAIEKFISRWVGCGPKGLGGTVPARGQATSRRGIRETSRCAPFTSLVSFGEIIFVDFIPDFGGSKSPRCEELESKVVPCLMRPTISSSCSHPTASLPPRCRPA
jgi:hypothetical protein